jgi:periplasmic protein CpxP/Spy
MKLGLAAIALGATALAWVAGPAVAQTVAQTQPMPPMEHHRGGMLRLNLTDAQREEIQAIADESQEAILNVLTDEQREQLESMVPPDGQRPGFRPGSDEVAPSPPDGQRPHYRGGRGGRGGMRDVFASLNLTNEQQEQIREIRENAHERVQAVLTEEQRQQMEEMRQNHWRPQ